MELLFIECVVPQFQLLVRQGKEVSHIVTGSGVKERGTLSLLRLSVKRVRVPIPNLLSLVESEKPLSIALPSFSSSSRILNV